MNRIGQIWPAITRALRLFAVAAVLAPALGAMAHVATARAEMSGPAKLVVNVTSLRSGEGKVHFGLYDREDGFPTFDGRLAGAEVAADKAGVTYEFSDLPPGLYAVTVFHDENANGEFDFNFIGLPKEGYGFSNGATGFLSAPSFQAAGVKVGEDDAKIVIQVTY